MQLYFTSDVDYVIKRGVRKQTCNEIQKIVSLFGIGEGNKFGKI